MFLRSNCVDIQIFENNSNAFNYYGLNKDEYWKIFLIRKYFKPFELYVKIICI